MKGAPLRAMLRRTSTCSALGPISSSASSAALRRSSCRLAAYDGFVEALATVARSPLRTCVSIGLLAGAMSACRAGRTCVGPSREVTPPRAVRAPDTGLLGIKLDADANQVRQQCSKLGTVNPMASEPVISCQFPPPERYDSSEWIVGFVLVRFDRFGRAKSIAAEGTVDASAEPSVLAPILREISAATKSEPAEGGLVWCASKGLCRENADFAKWYFEGGEVWLRSRRDGLTFELELSHTSPELEERVIYGLPVCE